MQVRNGIDNPAQVQSAATPTVFTGASSEAAKQSQRSSLAADQTRLSAASSQLAVDAGGEVRAEKVAGIQSALKAGTYQVPASAVAQRLITTMLEQE